MLELIKISDLDLSNKTVLVREDYNVPVKAGRVVDDARIVASLPTLRQISQEDSTKIMIVSHLGRPKAGEYAEVYSLQPVADCLTRHIGKTVPLVKGWVKGVDFSDHQIVLCENVRFEHGEKENDDAFAREMAALCHVYVNDAFATAHRAHASTHGIAKYAAVACAGPLLINELKTLNKVLEKPEKPVILIVGGGKISSKLILLHSLLDQVDQLIVGGAIANTFLRAAGHNIGASLYEPDLLDETRKIMRKAQDKGCTVPLPTDVVCAKQFSEDACAEHKQINAVAEDDLILDFGVETTKRLSAILTDAATIIWNGPLGAFEFTQFGLATRAIAEAVAASPAYSVAGGGDTLAAIAQYGVAKDISYISTGGGAFLAFLERRTLPTVAILEEAAQVWAAMERGRDL